MEISSLARVGRGAVRTLRRFPAPLAAAALATAAGLVLVEGRGDGLWERVLGAALLGLPLTFAVTLLAERRGWGPVARWTLHGLAAVLLGGVFGAWSGWSDPVAARRWVQLAAGFHLLAAFLPFVGVREPRGFWQYNRVLFLRFLTAALYSAVLFAGLALALAALDQLFGLPVPDDAYPRLWILFALLFHPWLFLAGVPEEMAGLERRTDYPRGLELFTQYALVPLVAVYLAILTAYAARVLVTWNWPSGWIGWLVSAVGVSGILAALLVHPVRDEAEHRWVRIYGRWFWPALLPSVVLLMIAVGKRIGQYGVTEDRYFLAVLAAWLGSVAVYYTVRGFERLEPIPRSLCVLALVTFVGPWSAYAVSERSQRGRLEALLAEHRLVVDGTVRPAEGRVPADDRREISATIRYLLRVHGPEALAPAFGGRVPTADPAAVRGPPPEPGTDVGPGRETGAVGDTTGREHGAPPTSARPEPMPPEPAELSRRPRPSEVMAALGLEYVDPAAGRAGTGQFAVHRGEVERPAPLEDYRSVLPGLSSARSGAVAAPGAGVEVRTDATGVRLVRQGRVVLELPVAAAPALRRPPLGRGPVPAGELWIRRESDGLRAGLWLERAVGRRAGPADSTVSVRSWRGDLYLGW